MNILRKKSREFSTKKADYTLNPQIHLLSAKIRSGLEDFDAIALETGFHTYDYWNMKELTDEYLPYHDLVNENLKLEKPKPIFYVDLPPKEIFRNGKTLGYFLKNTIEGLPIAFPAAYSLANFPLASPLALPFVSGYILPFFRGYSKEYDFITGHLSLSGFYTSDGLRSAVSAKKIEEFIVPEIGKRKASKGKPNILLDFGASHGDLEPYLKHKTIRDIVIGFHKKLKLHTRDMIYLNKVCEMRSKKSEAPQATDKIIQRKNEDGYEDLERILYRI